MSEIKPNPPQVDSSLRHLLRLPASCYQASGIVVNGRRIKSPVITTDLAIIRNCDADAVFAVYPFTPPSTAELFQQMMAKYRESETIFTSIRNLTSFHHYSILG